MKSKGGLRLIIGAFLLVLVCTFLLTGGFLLFIREQGGLAKNLSGNEEMWMPQEQLAQVEVSDPENGAAEEGFIKAPASSETGGAPTPEPGIDAMGIPYTLYYEDEQTKVFLLDSNGSGVKRFEGGDGIVYCSFYDVSVQMKRISELYDMDLTGKMDMYFNFPDDDSGIYGWTVIAKNDGFADLAVSLSAETAKVNFISYFTGSQYWYTGDYDRFLLFGNVIQPRLLLEGQSVGQDFGHLNIDDAIPYEAGTEG